MPMMRLAKRVIVAIALAVAAAAVARGAENMKGPDDEMMKPIMALTRFMISLDRKHLEGVFAHTGVTIVENFSPYVFTGQNAAAHWEAGFRAHAGADKLSDLTLNFGDAQDYGRSGERAFFTLPTTWRGKNGAQAFEEQGAWSFVLTHAKDGWLVLAYGWGVTSAKVLAP
jgi:hypothetical protein